MRARDVLTPTLPGLSAPSLRNWRQLASRQYSVPLEKWSARICCWMGLTRNCETWGERSCSHESVVSHRWMTRMRTAWVVAYIGSRSGEGGAGLAVQIMEPGTI